MTLAVQAELRNKSTKCHLRQLRENKMIPGIVYGKGTDNVPISIHEQHIHSLLTHHANSIIELDVPGLGKRQVVIMETQKDILTNKCRHIDFQIISMNETIHSADEKKADQEVAVTKEDE